MFMDTHTHTREREYLVFLPSPVSVKQKRHNNSGHDNNKVRTNKTGLGRVCNRHFTDSAKNAIPNFFSVARRLTDCLEPNLKVDDTGCLIRFRSHLFARACDRRHSR